MKTKKFLILILVLISTKAFALDEIIRHYRSPRVVGMGGVRTTTGIYEDSLFGGNPALLAMPEDWKLQILGINLEANSNFINTASKFSTISSASGADTFTKIADAGLVGRNLHERFGVNMGFYTPTFFSDKTAFGFGILANQQLNAMLRTNTDMSVQGYLDVGPGIGVAKRFLNNSLYVGASIRAIYRLAADRDIRTVEFLGGKKLSLTDIGGQGVGLDGDLGAFYKVPLELPIVKFSVGASINNVAASQYDFAGRTLIKKVGDVRPPQNYRSASLGVRADFESFAVLTDNKAAIEIQDIGSHGKVVSFWKRTHLGAETRLIRLISLRGGFNQGYYTLGLGLNLPVLKIDLATYGEEIGTNAGMLEDRRYIAKIAIEF
jgi:hypothetical protein